jgi:hypothetical protein
MRERNKVGEPSALQQTVRDMEALDAYTNEEIRAKRRARDEREQELVTRAADTGHSTLTIISEDDITMPNVAFVDKDNILAKAWTATQGKRREEYGTPSKNHTFTAKLWDAYIRAVLLTQGIEIPEHVSPTGGNVGVCLMNVHQKISRHAVGGCVTEDTFVDIAGFAENAAGCWKAEQDAADA